MCDGRKNLIAMLKKKVKVPGLLDVLDEFRSDPKVKLSEEEFDLLLSPMLNNPLPLFNFL